MASILNVLKKPVVASTTLILVALSLMARWTLDVNEATRVFMLCLALQFLSMIGIDLTEGGENLE